MRTCIIVAFAVCLLLEVSSAFRALAEINQRAQININRRTTYDKTITENAEVTNNNDNHSERRAFLNAGLACLVTAACKPSASNAAYGDR